jgi:uroporphyrinogen-III synthase
MEGTMALAGRRILITRTRQQASELAAQLEEMGAEAILIPTIELAPPTSFESLDRTLNSIASFEWILFTSANAVQAFATRARELGVVPELKKIAVIGPATARAVRGIGLRVDLMPEQYVAESLADALRPLAAGISMLLVRAEQARDVLPLALDAAGARLTIAHAYRNIVPLDSVAALQQVLSDSRRYPDAITFTSSSTVTNLFSLLDAAALQLPDRIERVSIGPITSRTLRELGHPATIEASEPTVAALCVVLREHFGNAEMRNKDG